MRCSARCEGAEGTHFHLWDINSVDKLGCNQQAWESVAPETWAEVHQGGSQLMPCGDSEGRELSSASAPGTNCGDSV